jgi:CHAT domain-containing protein
LSENEKTAFHNNTCKYIFENFNAFVLSEFLKNGEKTDKKLISRFFDGQLFSKAILLQASQKMKNRILNSSDTILIKKFNQWAELRKEISSHEQMSEEERSESEINADSIKLVANEIEKYLSRASESFANLTENKSVSWKDLQAKLKDDEMCIEIVRVRKFGLKKLITDLSDTLKAPNFPKYPLYGLNDSVYYVALLLKKNDKFPIFLPLENGTYLENSGINFYRNAVRFHVLDTVSYRNFFAKIFKNIKGIKKVYFSPDGVYNQLNINTLYIPETKKYLQEVLEIHQLTNSKDILTFAALTEKKEAKSGFAALFGRPSFLLSDSAPKPAESAPVMRDVATRGLRSVRGTDFTDLPGTEIEVKQIDSLLQKRAFSTKSFLATEATEENLKKIENPNILHIATHGFFIPQENKLNPMLLSGVLLAGVSNFLAGSDSAEDGILTAFEAQNLNLEKTELVVLSACETALGSVRSGEGVYGLQRAFKVAGAKSLLMSLWKVDDRVTQELMSAFYAHYVENKSIRNSFVKAQADIRKKYPQPFYWGAFVLIGE